MDAVRVVTFTGGAVALLAAAYALHATSSGPSVASRIPGPVIGRPSLGGDPGAIPNAATPNVNTDVRANAPPACDCAHAADAGTAPQERLALQRACEASVDEHCNEPWSVFATLPDAVVVRRSTGTCGGCGALTHATVFRGEDVVTSAELGRFGRFGNGPDAADWVTVSGARVLALDWSESQGGYSYEYRSFYFVDEAGLHPGACVVTTYSNTGAVEDDDQLAWTATLTANSAGALDVRYRITQRGPKAVKRIAPLHVPADQLRADDGDCVQPQ
jgi:hypothetical protein